MRRFGVFAAVLLCFPVVSYAQYQAKPKEDNRAFVRPWLTTGFKSQNSLNEPSVAPVFRGGVFFLRQDKRFGADINMGWTPASLKYNFRSMVHLKKGLFSDFGADYVYRRDGVLPTYASYFKGGAAYIKENKRNRIEVAGGLGVEFLSYNRVGRDITLSDKHSVMFYSLFRFDWSLAGSGKWMLRLENEPTLVRNPYDPSRRLGFNSVVSAGIVYKGYYKSKN